MAAAAQPKPATPVADPLAERWREVEALPCVLAVEIPVPNFTVGDLVHLEPSRIVATGWTVGQDVPLSVNGELIAWSEFEVARDRLAVRLTELA